MNQENSKLKERYMRIAATIAIIGNSVLAVSKIVIGTMSGSNALVGDGIDSSTDVVISLIMLIIVKFMSVPADKKHPWGHRRAETIATAFLSFVIFFAGAQLFINSISNLISGTHTATLSVLAIGITAFSVVGKLLLAYSQHILGKRADSAIIKANAKNMASDVLISLGVLIGFGVTAITGTSHADCVVAMLIGLWIIKTAVGIFADVNMELMDGNDDIESYRVIIDAVNAVEGASNPHRARMRCISGFWDISFDIYVCPECSVADSHDIASQVEDEIRKRLESIYDIVIHVEPSGDEGIEGYGLSEHDINNEEQSGN